MKEKRLKAWIVISKRTKKPARFVREGTPIEWEVFPHKYKSNQDYYLTLPCLITYILPAHKDNPPNKNPTKK